MKTIYFDELILFTIIILAALPFAQIFHLEFAGIILNAFELIYLALIILILFKFLMDGRIEKTYLPFLLFIITVVVHFFISISVYDRQILDIINQLRHYFPFLIATILLAVGTIVKTERYLRLLVIASIFSSAIALMIHHLMPDLMAKMLSSSSRMVALTTVHGRLYWTNSCLVFFVILLFLLPKKEIYVNKAIMSIALLFTLAGLFNTLNRTMVIGLILFLGGYIFFEKHFFSFVKRAKKIIGLSMIGIVMIIGLMFISPKLKHMIEERYLRSSYQFEYMIESEVVTERFPIYRQYINSIKKYFPIGQGLGKPFHIHGDDIEVPVSDVSFLSFLLPFGLIGLIIFFIFIYMLFRLIIRENNCISERGIRIIKLFFIIALIMSLNIDFFSRNNFVIFITMLFLTFQNDKSMAVMSDTYGKSLKKQNHQDSYG